MLGYSKMWILLFYLLTENSAKKHYRRDYIQQINDLINYQIREDDDYPVKHAFIDKKVKVEWSTLILGSYSRRIPLVIFRSDQRPSKFASSNRIKLHQVIAVFESLNDVNITKWKQKVKDMWDPRSQFVIWITGKMFYAIKFNNTQNSKGVQHLSNCLARWLSTSATQDSIRKLFQDFWAYNSLNVVIISFNATSKHFDKLSFNPFVLAEDGKRGKVYYIKENEKWFPDKFTDLHGYPIKISIFHKPPMVEMQNNNTEMKSGEDVEFIEILQSRMNFSLILLTDRTTAANYGVLLPNGESVGLTADILLNRSEVLGNSQYIDVIFDRKLEALYPYDSGTYYAVVPRMPRLSSLHIVGHHWFSYKTLTSLVPVALLALYLFIRKERYPIFAAWNLILHQQFLKMGWLNSDRIIRFTWIVYAMLITCGFEGRLIKMLTSPEETKEIDTLEDLDMSNLTLMVGDKMFEPINQSSLPEIKSLARKTKTNLNFSHCWDRLLIHGDVACASDKLSALFTLSDLLCTVSVRRVHMMHEELGNFWLTYVVKKNLPYQPKFDYILRNLIESGIKAKAVRNSANSITTRFHKKILTFRNDGTIKIWHLKTLLWVFFVTLILSFVVFLIEYYIGTKSLKSREKMKQRVNNKIKTVLKLNNRTKRKNFFTVEHS